MKYKIWGLIVIVFLVIAFWHFPVHQEIWSVDKAYRLVAYSKKGFVIVELYAASGKRLYEDHPRVSTYQRWNILWKDKENFLLENSDVGNYYYRKNGDSWVREREGFVVSPSKEFILSIEKPAHDKKFDVAIYKPESIQKPGSLNRLYATTVRDTIDDIRASTSWQSNSKVLISATRNKYIVEQDADGHWDLKVQYK